MKMFLLWSNITIKLLCFTIKGRGYMDMTLLLEVVQELENLLGNLILNNPCSLFQCILCHYSHHRKLSTSRFLRSICAFRFAHTSILDLWYQLTDKVIQKYNTVHGHRIKCSKSSKKGQGLDFSSLTSIHNSGSRRPIEHPLNVNFGRNTVERLPNLKYWIFLT